MLLSVVIPTKNRPDTLYHAVRSALAIPSGDLEVVVQDCGAGELAEQALAPLAGDRRLRYARSTGAPSMTQNWNLAFERVQGEYAVVLGDDDAVGNEIANAARWASRHGVDAIADSRLTYLWPDYQLREAAGTVRVSVNAGPVVFEDAQRTLRRTLSRYPVDPLPLPHIYQGLVRMRMMHEIKTQTGAFFHSMAPDFYSTVALACLAKRFAHAAYPLCAAGASAAANSGRMHEGRDHLHALEYREPYEWAAYVPGFYSMPTAIVDATIKALMHMRREDTIPLLDYPSFYADCLAQSPGRALAVLGTMRRLVRDHPSLDARLRLLLVPRTVQMTARRLRRLAGRSALMTGLKRWKARFSRVDYEVVAASDIVEAVERAQSLLESKGISSPFAGDTPHAFAS